MRRKRKKTGVKRKLLARLLVYLCIIWWTIGYISSLYLTRTSQKTIPKSPRFWGKEIEYVSIQTTDDVEVKASFIQGVSTEKCVIILSGIKANRISCYQRAKLYLKKGYSVLLPDLRGTGETKGEKISFGWNEKNDVIASVNFLKSRNFTKISAHGSSLGAATIVYTLPSIQYDFIVLESCYDNINHAFYNRLEKLNLPIEFYYPIEKITGWRIGEPLKELNPVEIIKKGNCPVLYLAGDKEVVIKKKETEAIFNAIANSKKQLHWFKNGKHEDFLANYREEYKEVWYGFIEEIIK